MVSPGLPAPLAQTIVPHATVPPPVMFARLDTSEVLMVNALLVMLVALLALPLATALSVPPPAPPTSSQTLLENVLPAKTSDAKPVTETETVSNATQVIY